MTCEGERGERERGKENEECKSCVGGSMKGKREMIKIGLAGQKKRRRMRGEKDEKNDDKHRSG